MNTATATGASGADTQIAHQIKNALIVKGINHKELATRISISFSTLRRSLDQNRADRRSFTIQELTEIAEALEVPVAAILPPEITRAAA